ncbi:hypothetical protein [Planctomycetes bacterium CA13]
MTRNASDPTKQSRPRIRRAIVWSVLFHIGLIVALFFWYVPNAKTASRDKSDTPPTTEKRPSNTVASPPPVVDIDVPPEQIKTSLESSIDQAAKANTETKLAEFDKNLRRLEQFEDQASLDDVADAVAQSMGLDRNLYSGKPQPTEGGFDHETAQILRVDRSQDEDENWRYEATMVDAQGHQSKVPMTEVEGKTVYEAFEKMKQYPMAQGIYRQLVMPMLQKMLEADEAGREALE